VSEMQFLATGYAEKDRLKNETLFHTASGRLGVRGCFEEGTPEGVPSIRGTYINGFCEKEAILYNERLYGFPEEKQQIVNLPDAQTVKVYAEVQLLACWNSDDMVRTLDMAAGLASRSFSCPVGTRRLRLSFTRLVSFVRTNVYAVECRVESTGYTGEVTVVSELNANVTNFTDSSDPRVASGSGKMLQTDAAEHLDNVMGVTVETRNGHRVLHCAVVHDGADFSPVPAAQPGLLAARAVFPIRDSETRVFHKYALYEEGAFCAALPDVAKQVKEAAKQGFEELKRQQKAWLDEFWTHARVVIEGSSEDRQTQLDFCLWGMLCSAGKDGFSNVAAKGLSGEGYEGHYFWDSEIYVFPFFLNTEPAIAKALLQYRYQHLDSARAHARIMGHSVGALYPWRTITGSECSSHYPSGSAQYHINGDISRAFAAYWQATHDRSFLSETCEVLVETARLWLDAGHWVDGSFRIDCVTGPDEYTCIVNNNYYTNACAAANLLNAVKLCRELTPDALDALKEKLHLAEEELPAFQNAGEHMFFPFDEKLGIVAQDDSFLSKKRWDFRSLPKSDFPLLMHYHPLQINRCQVLKQADAVLANYLYREETPLTMMRSYCYYEDITTHDSSLSHCIYAIMAARLGDMAKATAYFSHSIGIDTADENGNTRDGLHIANMGGAYAVLTAGFGGIRISEEELSLFPLLPEGMQGIRFPVCYRGSRILVRILSKGCTLRLTDGAPLEVSVYGEKVLVTGEERTVLRKVHGVIFDLDGVITDTAGFHFSAWKKIADELGVPFDEKRNEQFKGVSRKTCLELLLQWGNLRISGEEFDTLLTRKNDYYRELLSTLSPENILPGMKDCLEELHRKGIPVALFSVSKNTDMILRNIGLTGAFDGKVTGNDITYSKPHFEGYLLAAQRIGVDPRLCVMVEDSVAGINGARALSLFSLAIMSENSACADVCVPDTTKVLSALETLL